MKERYLTAALIDGFRKHLIAGEKSPATVEKYIRDAKAFSAYVKGNKIIKETAIAYKQYLLEHYAAGRVNSMLASLNSMFAFLGWHEMKVKSVKLQRQIYCPEEKELTKAEYARLCRAAENKHNKWLDMILQTICGTGIRVSELKYITLETVSRYGGGVRPCRCCRGGRYIKNQRTPRIKHLLPLPRRSRKQRAEFDAYI